MTVHKSLIVQMEARCGEGGFVRETSDDGAFLVSFLLHAAVRPCPRLHASPLGPSAFPTIPHFLI